MNRNADSECDLRVGSFYTLLVLTQRQAGRGLSQGVHRLPGDRWVYGIQPGAEHNPLRLLEPRQTEMAGGYAGGRHSKDQQSCRGIPILQ